MHHEEKMAILNLQFTFLNTLQSSKVQTSSFYVFCQAAAESVNLFASITTVLL
jgi:hypothetical protein